jgi:hypothetical protein
VDYRFKLPVRQLATSAGMSKAITPHSPDEAAILSALAPIEG